MELQEFDVLSVDDKEKKIYIFCKRIIDILGASVGIILFFIPMLIIAIAIKLENPKGTIFFTQNRCGLNGNVFKMYKFRSMIMNAEEQLSILNDRNEMDGPVFKIKDDPRISKVGKFIRNTSLDELPQLFNILKGDMSLVGPRPALVSEVKQYTEYQMKRLDVKPGLTCIWQVSGRNNIDFDTWVELDLYYIKHQSLLLDFKLILSTIPLIFGDKNAS